VLTPEVHRKALDLAEQFADQPPHQRRFEAVRRGLWELRHGRVLSPAQGRAADAVARCFDLGSSFAVSVADGVVEVLGPEKEQEFLAEPPYLRRWAARKAVRRDLADLVREVFNTFRLGTLDS